MKKIRRLVIALLLCLSLLVGCLSETHQKEIEWTMVKGEGITLSDGAQVNLWRSNTLGYTTYKLSDETILLTVQDPIGPTNVYVGGVESYDDLGESAQKAVTAFYEEQGLLYDIQSELKNAYAAYQACKANEKLFDRAYFISQEIVPTASNDRIMCFLTCLTRTCNGETDQEVRVGTVFNRESGELINTWELFTLKENEARQWLLDALEITDSKLRIEMEAALKSENIILFPDYLEVTFSKGTLPSQAYSYTTGIAYDKLQGILQTWAIPNLAKA